MGNTEKKKWLYALNLNPVDKTRMSELIQRTTDETLSPYPIILLQNHPGRKTGEKSQYFYDMNSKDDKKKHKRTRMEFDKNKCWFCLSSQDASKHLVISIGQEIYLALAKGGVVDDHFLITPVEHHQSVSILPEDVRKELSLYKVLMIKLII